MILLIVLIVLAILTGVTLFLLYRRNKNYDEFIAANSVGLSVLNKINNRYSFYPYVGYDQVHIYDNENFYDDISCEDYLIYQLQFIGGKVMEQIKKQLQTINCIPNI